MEAGKGTQFADVPGLPPCDEDFLKFVNPVGPMACKSISGYRIHSKNLRKSAANSVAAGNIVSLFIFFHGQRFSIM